MYGMYGTLFDIKSPDPEELLCKLEDKLKEVFKKIYKSECVCFTGLWKIPGERKAFHRDDCHKVLAGLALGYKGVKRVR